MDLASVFYLMSIIFMSLLTVIAVGIIALIIIVAVQVVRLKKFIEAKVEEVTAPFRKGSEFIDNLREML